MGARYGDAYVQLASGEILTLRLSFGALSEMVARLKAPGPMALAARLNPLNDDDTKIIVRAMSFAATGQRDFEILDVDLPTLSAAIASQFEDAFSEGFL